MPGYRPERVAEMIHRELAERLRSDIKDERLAMLSITSIEVTRDLSRATISYMPLGGGAPSEDLVEAVEAAAKRLRGPIGRALRLRHAPELVFVYDEHTDAAFRVTAILDRLKNERLKRDEAELDADDVRNGESEGDEE
jgi:ribosome-binding factor A